MVYREERDNYLDWFQMKNWAALRGCSVPDDETIPLGGNAAAGGGGGGGRTDEETTPLGDTVAAGGGGGSG